jgi:hypothetical protein
MAIGVVMIVVGSAVYLGTPAIAVARRGPKPAPGGHDHVPALVTTVALPGGLIALLGIVVVVLSMFGVI